MGKQVRIQWIPHTLTHGQTGAITLMIIAHAGTWAKRSEYSGYRTCWHLGKQVETHLIPARWHLGK